MTGAITDVLEVAGVTPIRLRITSTTRRFESSPSAPIR